MADELPSYNEAVVGVGQSFTFSTHGQTPAPGPVTEMVSQRRFSGSHMSSDDEDPYVRQVPASRVDEEAAPPSSQPYNNGGFRQDEPKAVHSVFTPTGPPANNKHSSRSSGGFVCPAWSFSLAESHEDGCCEAGSVARMIYFWFFATFVVVVAAAAGHGWSSMGSCGPGYDSQGFQFGLTSYNGPNLPSSPESYSDCGTYHTYDCDDLKSSAGKVLTCLIVFLVSSGYIWLGLTFQACFRCGLVGLKSVILVVLIQVATGIAAPVMWLVHAQADVQSLREYLNCHEMYIGWPVWTLLSIPFLTVVSCGAALPLSSGASLFEAKDRRSMYW